MFISSCSLETNSKARLKQAGKKNKKQYTFFGCYKLSQEYILAYTLLWELGQVKYPVFLFCLVKKCPHHSMPSPAGLKLLNRGEVRLTIGTYFLWIWWWPLLVKYHRIAPCILPVIIDFHWAFCTRFYKTRFEYFVPHSIHHLDSEIPSVHLTER